LIVPRLSQRILTVAALLFLSACSGSPVSRATATDSPATPSSPPALTYNGIDLLQPKDASQEGAPQPAWLVVGRVAIPATYAAFTTLTAQVDPALSNSDIATLMLPSTTDTVTLVIAPGAIDKLDATLRPWTGTVIPLLDPKAAALRTDTQPSTEGMNVFAVRLPVKESAAQTTDRLLEIHTTFPIPGTQVVGEAYYVWLLKSAEN
jgi:hypothetical protein